MWNVFNIYKIVELLLLSALNILNLAKVQCPLEAGYLEDATTRGRAPACKVTREHVLSLDHMYLGR